MFPATEDSNATENHTRRPVGRDSDAFRSDTLDLGAP